MFAYFSYIYFHVRRFKYNLFLLYYYRNFYSPVLRLFIDGSLNAVKLQIYGSSMIKTILREPRFPDSNSKYHILQEWMAMFLKV